MSDPKLPPHDDGAPSDAPTVFDDGKTTRREFVGTTVVGGALLSTGLLAVPDTAEAASPKPANVEGPPVAPVAIKLQVNGKEHTLEVEPRVTLLDALRERLGLTGSKKGCDMGQCGACTVLVDDRRVNACLTLAVMQQGKRITTIEGLAQGDTLHPMQQAFIEHDAFQCGYCTPGQIMSAVGFSREQWGQSDADIREGMCGNICRCGAYPHIVAAVRDGRGKKA
jgi:xanthine dehydrogenase YagT iron-sulfur-binding subunit